MTKQDIAGRMDSIVRQDHPYDNGYWAAFDGLPRPTDAQGREGWDDCIRDQAFEAACLKGLDIYDARKAADAALAAAKPTGAA